VYFSFVKIYFFFYKVCPELYSRVATSNDFVAKIFLKVLFSSSTHSKDLI